MEWKDQLISSTDGAGAFLAAALADADMPAHHFSNSEEGDVDAVGFRAVAQDALARKRAPVENELLSVCGHRESGAVTAFTDLYVHKDYRRDGVYGGKRLGARGIKAFLGCDCAAGASVVRLDNVCDNGDSLWLRLGGVPAAPLDYLEGALAYQTELMRERLTRGDIDLFSDIKRVAARSFTHGWIALGRAHRDLSEQGRCARGLVINRLMAQERPVSLYLFLAEGPHRAFMQELVGVIPPFRPLPARHALERVYASVCDYAL